MNKFTQTCTRPTPTPTTNKRVIRMDSNAIYKRYLRRFGTHNRPSRIPNITCTQPDTTYNVSSRQRLNHSNVAHQSGCQSHVKCLLTILRRRNWKKAWHKSKRTSSSHSMTRRNIISANTHLQQRAQCWHRLHNNNNNRSNDEKQTNHSSLVFPKRRSELTHRPTPSLQRTKNEKKDTYYNVETLHSNIMHSQRTVFFNRRSS